MEIRDSRGQRSSPHLQTYEIRVRAILEAPTVEWLGEVAVCRAENDETVLVGALPDQAALFGVLLRLHNLGIPLISVNPCANT